MKKILFFPVFIILLSQVLAQSSPGISPIYFIFDASGSMWGQIEGRTKMEIASEVLSESVGKLPEHQQLGLVIYGHNREGDCRDVEFMVNPEGGTKAEVIEAVNSVKPLGKTPLAYSANLVIEQLRQSKTKATIILITDGIESCDGNICEVVSAAQGEGIDFKLHIIGFGLKDEETAQLKCAAKAANGTYNNAEDALDLGDLLAQVTNKTIDDPEENFTVYAVKNGVPVDAWVKAYDVVSKREPILARTYRDTAFFYLPPSRYNFEVVPLEGSDVDKISLSEIQSFEDSLSHQTVSFDAGKLSITVTNNGQNWDSIVKLIDQNGEVTASERTYTSQKEVEVNPGKYKISVQALKVEGLGTLREVEGVEILSGQSTPFEMDFETGTFKILTWVNGKIIDTIVTLAEAESGKNVGGERTYTDGADFILTPGKYNVKVVPLGDHKEKAAHSFSIEIKPGEEVLKEIQF